MSIQPAPKKQYPGAKSPGYYYEQVYCDMALLNCHTFLGKVQIKLRKVCEAKFNLNIMVS